MAKELPKRYDPKESEKNWQDFWEKSKIYSFDVSASDKETYSVDTPPPTVSGRMHMGHAFSYAQQDFLVRYQRMRGKNVFYPFGTDNNGVATERLIEKHKKVRAKTMPREDFVRLCEKTVKEELIPQYTDDMRRLGLSCDFTLFYNTIDDHSRRISQKSFIDLYNKGREYRKDAPTMWCPACETGISQVEMEDKELESTFNDIIFKVKGNDGKEQDLIIATTRPELLPACVAVFFHPEDGRYRHLEGKEAIVPLFGFNVPIMKDSRVDPSKGTGIVMCCTFGDTTDMEWQKAYSLPIKMAISTGGRMTEIAGKFKDLKITEARKAIIEDLNFSGLLTKQEPIRHAVNVHERCGTEVEFIKSKQWFIRYLDKKEEMLKWAEELNWYPKHMRVRYDHWVKGLAWDWMISRQRYFGVPFPVWYCKDCEEVILAKEEDLPVDPIKDNPPVKECQRCKCKDFIPEKDIMDTWATSSLTPKISTQLVNDKIMQKKLYPMSLRPQAHDIITFWLFNTVVKSQLEDGQNPWKDVAISGHALDPKGKKMSKSKGNVIEPQSMIGKYSADSLRFWAAGSKLGTDMPFMEKDLVTGQKFINKLWNASRFAFMHLEDFDGKEPAMLEPVDRWILSRLSRLIEDCTSSFEKYEYFKNKLDTEKFFWQDYCDNYMEIVKDRLYNPGKRGKKERISAQYALYNGLLSILKLVAPIMPHITEELYQAYFIKYEKTSSIHLSGWPRPILSDLEAEKLGKLVVFAVQRSRQAKTENNMSLKSSISRILLRAKITKDQFESIKPDIIGASGAEDLCFEQLDADSGIDEECVITI